MNSKPSPHTASIWQVGNLTSPNAPVNSALCREALKQGRGYLKQQFDQGADINELLRQRSQFVDEVLQQLWSQFIDSTTPACLLAVGGYGRAELHPYSDVDVLILLDDSIADVSPDSLSQFLTELWDIGLEIGHSVRTIADCLEQAATDISAATNMLEVRVLCGQESLFQQLQQLTASNKPWDTRRFYELKKKEQQNRHNKYNDTANNLEPNVKESPGGLRDIQTVSWVAQQHYDVKYLEGLRQKGFLSNNEYDVLHEAHAFLSKIRFALHHLAERKQEKLTFDHQRTLAKQFGYQDTPSRQAVEQFMKDYYRCARSVQQMNSLLLQLFEETIILVDEPREIEVINRRFQNHNGYLETINAGIFAYYPYALLEIFLILQQNSHIKGVRAATIRQIHAHIHLIDDAFRANIKNRTLFMEILRQPKGLTRQLRQMNELGVLGAYLPEFGQIVGQMQHDMFHAYTVDEHTLFLVRNLRRFSDEQYKNEFPLCSKIFLELPKAELIYIAGIYHDIAKGRGGDHSILGQTDVKAFSERHGLSPQDIDIVTFLVRQHLAMSIVAQKSDIDDPNVIKAFAETVGNVTKLNYLYLLTVADIRATNNHLWNGWRDSLLKRLYNLTRQWLEHTETQAKNTQQFSYQKYEQSMQQLIDQGFQERTLSQLWESYDSEYFLRHTVDEIVWQTTQRLENKDKQTFITIRQHHGTETLEIFITTVVKPGLFAAITACLEQCQLNILDAKINNTRDNYALNTFIVNGHQLHQQDISRALEACLASPNAIKAYKPTITPRTSKLFKTKPTIVFSSPVQHNHTVMELYTHDRPGLLSAVAQTFLQQDIQVLGAKLITLGDQVEDVFSITTQDGGALNKEQAQALENKLKKTLI